MDASDSTGVRRRRRGPPGAGDGVAEGLRDLAGQERERRPPLQVGVGPGALSGAEHVPPLLGAAVAHVVPCRAVTVATRQASSNVNPAVRGERQDAHEGERVGGRMVGTD